MCLVYVNVNYIMDTEDIHKVRAKRSGDMDYTKGAAAQTYVDSHRFVLDVDDTTK